MDDNHISELGKPTRWKPGQSGNPSGRPKAKQLDQVLAELLTENECASAYSIAKALIRKAKRGSLPAAQLIVERVCGKPRQAIDLGARADNGDSLTPCIKIEFVKPKPEPLLPPPPQIMAPGSPLPPMPDAELVSEYPPED